MTHPGLVSRTTAFQFALMCLIWGTTWIAIKLVVDVVPPVFTAGARFTAAGPLILLLTRQGVAISRVRSCDVPRLASVSLLLIAVPYALLTWAIQYMPTGVEAVINLALVPIGLLGIGVLARQERATASNILALTLGLAGLVLLLGPMAVRGFSTGRMGLLGASAAVLGTLSYCAGSILARPLLVRYPAGLIAGVTNASGGAAMLALSLCLEPKAVGIATHHLAISAVLAWLYLVVFGSAIAFTIFMVLLRDWGPARAGAYAFVSPIVALIVGIALNGERLNFAAAMATLLLLAAVVLTLARKLEPLSGAPDSAGPARSTSRSAAD